MRASRSVLRAADKTTPRPCGRCSWSRAHRDQARRPLFGPLTRLLAGRCLVFDVDWLIDASSTLSGAATVTDIPWEGFAQAWLAVSHGVAQSGLPTMLLGTLTPAGLETNVGRKWIGPIYGLLLDCPDEVRRQRIEARPPWRLRDTAEQARWAAWLRENIAQQIDTSRCSPEEAARAVADWAEGLLMDELAG